MSNKEVIAGITTEVVALPMCDMCTNKAEYDARIRNSNTWAYMCYTHYSQLGAGLGIGLGQQLVLKEQNV